MQQMIKVKCPICGKWLMSKERNCSGTVELFCKRCKKPRRIELKPQDC
jgi:endogenous inhibitor of DNA gyrase (YacG/DUF329 family)